MSYYDPKYYNYKNLNESQRKVIDIYDLAIKDAGNKAFIIEDMMGLNGDEEDPDIINKMQYQIADKAIDAVLEYLTLQRQELIVSLLDAGPQE